MRQPAFPPPEPCWLPMDDGRAFPAGRVWCVGRNYADHAREMGGDPTAEAPFFFSKPVTSLSLEDTVAYPPATGELHHEVELVVALGRGGRNLDEMAARACILAAGVGVDLTRRDVQAVARAAGRPWDLAKGFDASAPIGMLKAVGDAGLPTRGPIELEVNGRVRQQGDLGQMILSPVRLLCRLSEEVALKPGDLLMTGTPAGVGPLVPGDRVGARIVGLAGLEFRIVPES